MKKSLIMIIFLSSVGIAYAQYQYGSNDPVSAYLNTKTSLNKLHAQKQQLVSVSFASPYYTPETPVHVQGYVKSDGTYVSPYYRARPYTRNRHSQYNIKNNY